MTALLDVNVLLALAWPNHQHHAAAHRWFRRESQHGWASCALTQVAFVRLSSNPAFTSAAVPPAAAADLLHRLVQHDAHRYWGALPGMSAARLSRAAGHRQVTDAYLVQVAVHHRGRLATFDARTAAHEPSRVHVIES